MGEKRAATHARVTAQQRRAGVNRFSPPNGTAPAGKSDSLVYACENCGGPDDLAVDRKPHNQHGYLIWKYVGTALSPPWRTRWAERTTTRSG
jgi:hypothetical protein